MALKNTIGTYYIPESYNAKDYSQPRMVLIQTGGSALAANYLTTTARGCLQSAATADLGCGANAFHLLSVDFSLEKPTTTSEISVWYGGCRIAQVPTGTAGNYHLAFGPLGLVGPDITTTYTVSIVSTVGGATLKCWAVTGYYEV